MPPPADEQEKATARVALTSSTASVEVIAAQQGYQTRLLIVRHCAGVANLIPPKSCQRQLRGTRNCGPGASTTENGERVNVPSTRLASGPRAVTSTCRVGAR
jgi:hypothetical protein